MKASARDLAKFQRLPGVTVGQRVTLADTVFVPIPPSANNLFATVRGRRVKSKAYKAWLAEAVPMLTALAGPESYPCELRYSVFGPMHGNRDLANLEKPLSDALVAAGCIPDDKIKYVTGVQLRYHTESAYDRVVRVAFAPGAGHRRLD